MYRKSKRLSFFDSLNIDSLMDILTCTVGLMLFIVIFAIIEAGGVRVKMFTPIVRDAPLNSERKLFICKEGRIKFFDAIVAINKLLENWENYQNVPQIIESANRKNITDRYFKYQLEYREWTEGIPWKTIHRAILLVVKEKNEVKGETVEQLKSPSSNFFEIIQGFERNKNWITFSVDNQSLEVFRTARELCIKNGFVTGWDPVDNEFPSKIVIIGGAKMGRSVYDPTPEFTKPQW